MTHRNKLTIQLKNSPAAIERVRQLLTDKTIDFQGAAWLLNSDLAHSNIFSIENDAKTVKGLRKGFSTAIMYLTPHNGAGGKTICPFAVSAACAAPCLNTAGRGAIKGVQLARLRKTLALEFFQSDYLELLTRAIEAHLKKSAKRGLVPLIRLNGTSDILWERMPVRGAANIMDVFPGVQFYDYSKVSARFDSLPANYHITFSYSGAWAGIERIVQGLPATVNIAVVYPTRADIPVFDLGRPVVDGDASDIRHLDPVGSVVALVAKRKAKHDTSGFVRRVSV